MKLNFIFTVLFSATLFFSCDKKLPSDCYDKAFEEEHKNDFCTADCPSVTGCDGKLYCNACEMHRHGIKKEK